MWGLVCLIVLRVSWSDAQQGSCDSWNSCPPGTVVRTGVSCDACDAATCCTENMCTIPSPSKLRYGDGSCTTTTSCLLAGLACADGYSGVPDLVCPVNSASFVELGCTLSSQATSPQATSPQATSPQATSPQATSPQATSPQATPPQATSPQATSPQATSPQATSPQATSPQAVPQATSPQAVSPQAVSPQATSPQAASPQAVPSPPVGGVAPSATPATPSGYLVFMSDSGIHRIDSTGGGFTTLVDFTLLGTTCTPNGLNIDGCIASLVWSCEDRMVYRCNYQQPPLKVEVLSTDEKDEKRGVAIQVDLHVAFYAQLVQQKGWRVMPADLAGCWSHPDQASCEKALCIWQQAKCIVSRSGIFSVGTANQEGGGLVVLNGRVFIAIMGRSGLPEIHYHTGGDSALPLERLDEYMASSGGSCYPGTPVVAGGDILLPMNCDGSSHLLLVDPADVRPVERLSTEFPGAHAPGALPLNPDGPRQPSIAASPEDRRYLAYVDDNKLMLSDSVNPSTTLYTSPLRKLLGPVVWYTESSCAAPESPPVAPQSPPGVAPASPPSNVPEASPAAPTQPSPISPPTFEGPAASSPKAAPEAAPTAPFEAAVPGVVPQAVPTPVGEQAAPQAQAPQATQPTPTETLVAPDSDSSLSPILILVIVFGSALLCVMLACVLRHIFKNKNKQRALEGSDTNSLELGNQTGQSQELLPSAAPPTNAVFAPPTRLKDIKQEPHPLVTAEMELAGGNTFQKEATQLLQKLRKTKSQEHDHGHHAPFVARGTHREHEVVAERKHILRQLLGEGMVDEAVSSWVEAQHEQEGYEELPVVPRPGRGRRTSIAPTSYVYRPHRPPSTTLTPLRPRGDADSMATSPTTPTSLVFTPQKSNLKVNF